MIEGTVKWFNDQKGYGFIKASHKEYFVHYRDIQADGYKSLREGEIVKFTPHQDDNGRPQALNVWPRTELPAE